MNDVNEFKQQTRCQECSFYHGNNNIICTLHPYGPGDKTCLDWESRKEKSESDTMKSNEVNSDNDLRTRVILRSVTTITAIACVTFGAFKLNERYEIGIKSDAAHQNYVKNCQVLLQNAALSGTIDTSRPELEKAENWLKVNYDQNSFEYKDLRADLNYLRQQPPNSILPVSIVNSIQHSSQLISETEAQKYDGDWGDSLFCLLLLIVMPPAMLMMLVFAFTEDWWY